jgi:hypothetical protein
VADRQVFMNLYRVTVRGLSSLSIHALPLLRGLWDSAREGGFGGNGITAPDFDEGVGKRGGWLEETKGGKKAAGGRHKGRGDSERRPRRAQAVSAVRAREKARAR